VYSTAKELQGTAQDLGGGIQEALACGTDLCLDGKLSQATGTAWAAALGVRGILRPGVHHDLPGKTFEMTSRNILVFIRAERMGMIGLVILLCFWLATVFAFLITPYSPNRSLTLPMLRPSPKHLLGTDELGRDLFTRVVYGGRVSLMIGFTASLVAVTVGTLVGLVAGYFGKWIDDVLSRLIDLFLSIPSIPFMIVIATILGPGLYKIIFVIALTAWPRTARIIRSQTLEIKEREFIEASRSLGGRSWHLMIKHILPVVLPLAIANIILTIGDAIISESGLSFLGLGAPQVSWGTILHYGFAEGAISIGAWWYVIPPGLCIMLVVLGFTLAGLSMERWLDPMRRRMKSSP